MILWARCAKPVHMALIGSGIFAKIRKTKVGSVMEDVRLLEHRMEDHALGVMEVTQGEEAAFKLLMQSTTAVPDPFVFGNRNLLDLAYSLARKRFLQHHHSQALMELWWRGGYPDFTRYEVMLPRDFSYVRLLLAAIFPFANPYVRDTLQRQTGHTGSHSSEAIKRKHSELSEKEAFEALATLSQMRSFELSKAGGVPLGSSASPVGGNEKEAERANEKNRVSWDMPAESAASPAAAAPAAARMTMRKAKASAPAAADPTSTYRTLIAEYLHHGGDSTRSADSTSGRATRRHVASRNASSAERATASRSSDDSVEDESSDFTVSPLRSFYNIPAVIFVLRGAVRYAYVGFYAVFIASLAAQPSDDEGGVASVPDFIAVEVAWVILELGWYLGICAAALKPVGSPNQPVGSPQHSHAGPTLLRAVAWQTNDTRV